jgi:hypothetical protein
MTSFIIKITDGEKSKMFFDNADGYPKAVFGMFDEQYSNNFEKLCELLKNSRFLEVEDKNGWFYDYYYEFDIQQKIIKAFYADKEIESFTCKNI